MKNYMFRLMKWILCIYAIVLPWISIKKSVYYNSEEKVFFPSEIKGVTDCFLYGKSVFTIIVAAVLLVIIAVLLVGDRVAVANAYNSTDKVITACAGIYFVCTLMSCLMSRYKEIAIWGGINNFEGTFVLLSYMILFLASYCVVRFDKSINIKKYVSYYAFAECTIMFILTCIEQGYKAIYNIIAGYDMVELNGMLTLTFYNSTYCAAFTLLLFPFVIFFWLAAGSKRDRIIWTAYCPLMFICTILTRSAAAFYFAIIELMLVLVLYIVLEKCDIRRILLKILVTLAGALAVAVLISVLGVNIFSYINMSSKNTTEAVHKSEYYEISDIVVLDNSVTLINSESELECVVNDGKIQFQNQDGEIINVKAENNVIVFPEPYNMVTAGTDKNVLWIDLGYKGILRFYINDGSFYPMLSNGMLVKDISGGGYNSSFDNIFTGRGYIWRNSLGLLKNTVIFGHGAGTFEMYFKQFDFTGLLNAHGTVDLLIDKPHDWYLQMACNQGLLCGLAVIALIAYIIINAYITCIKGKKNILALPAIAAVIVFSAFGLLTDSYVTVNPEMWILLGVTAGMSINCKAARGTDKDE